MREVTEAEFFRVIGPMDVHPRVRGRYTDDRYGSDWVRPNGEIVGVTVATGPHPNWKPDSTYFLCGR